MITIGCNPNEGESYIPPDDDSLNSGIDNPVYSKQFSDMDILWIDSQYYAFGTEVEWLISGGFWDVPVLKSNDLVNWQKITTLFAGQKPDWYSEQVENYDGNMARVGVWASGVLYKNEHVYVAYSVSAWGDPNPAIGLLVAADPEGPYYDQGKLFDSEESGVKNGIDPCFFTEDDGSVFMAWGSFNGIYIAPVIFEAGNVGDTIQNVHVQLENKYRIAGTSYEAPYLLKKGDVYYLFLSAGTCCEGVNSTYSIVVGKSNQLYGDYIDRQGNSLNTSEQANIANPYQVNAGNLPAGEVVVESGGAWTGPGHNAVTVDHAGNYFLIYHAIELDDPKTSNGLTLKKFVIDILEWDEDGFPHVRNKIVSEHPVEPTIF
ncbi:MAG: family 43 glycosylhydrolase [Bacteroidales bacterium]|nr:family 43 glycosylhydrolase [Bacteroidales bacterium]